MHLSNIKGPRDIWGSVPGRGNSKFKGPVWRVRRHSRSYRELHLKGFKAKELHRVLFYQGH